MLSTLVLIMLEAVAGSIGIVLAMRWLHWEYSDSSVRLRYLWAPTAAVIALACFGHAAALIAGGGL